MIKPSNILVSLHQFDCARNISKYTWKDDNPDKVERLNEWGIMYYEKDDNTELSTIYLRQAIEKGSIDAMINGFTVLWSAGYYSLAYSWLKEMTAKPVKNIKCLWNQAMLLYYGPKIEHNPIKQDKQQATAILDYIVGHYYDFLDSKCLFIVQKAYIFLIRHSIHKIGDSSFAAYELWRKVNYESRRNYAIIGYNLFVTLAQYHDFPYDIGISIESEYLDTQVFRCLDELYIKDNWELNLLIGDINGFYLYRHKYGHLCEAPLRKHLRGTGTCRAAWQAYLLYSWYKCMPLEDHDNYDACRPIFKADDLSLWSFATFIPDKDYDEVTADMKALFTDEDVMPTVECIDPSKKQFAITCVWWNDWRGLFKERAMIEFDKHNRPTMKVLSSESLYPYQCPIEL